MRRAFTTLASKVAVFFIALWASHAWATGSLPPVSSSRTIPSFAFYYGTDIPWESLGAFDVAVVEPGNVGPAGWSHRLNPATAVAAYIAVGEVHPTRAYFKQMRPEWKLGENKAWGSIVVDQAAPGWSAFYVAQVIKPLWDTGYRAFFLDTLDSFTLVAKTPEARAQQIAGMTALIKTIKRAYPDAKLIFNRGFEILPEVHSLVYAVAAESLYQGWDAGKQAYVEVSQADRDWILDQLRKCQTDYQLPAIGIDYAPPEDRALAREAARRIKALGIIPWVTNPALDMMGVGQVEVVPRQVLVLHDEPSDLAEVSTHEAQRIGSLPLSYLGLDVRHVHHSAAEMATVSSQVLAGRYAGVMTWMNQGAFPTSSTMTSLLAAARAQKVPIVMMNALPDDGVLSALGVTALPSVKLTQASVLEIRSPYIGFEAEPQNPSDAFIPLTVQPGTGDVWLRWRSAVAGPSDVISITPWGGFAAGRSFGMELPQNLGVRWVVNPVEFFRAAFQVDRFLPVPDVTTKSGRRMLLIHVDGDGFPSRAEVPGTPLAPQVMLHEFLERYRWPSTVSLVEGEVAPTGLYAALSPLMEKTARQIFALPHVEAASHTYSHPFYWADAETSKVLPNRVVSLKIPGYGYDANREITGARDYINQLLPPGKKTRAVLWSGDTQPLATPVRLAYEAGLLNMNGGFTTTSQAAPSLTLVAPLGMMKGDYYQIYAPMQNENVYTNNWTGPFYGFERIIETFNRTEIPLRLKPVNIYYHTYIATKRASIASLHKVYGWAEEQLRQQRLHPVFASQYMERVLDWRRATVARTETGLELRGGQQLRQWRMDAGAALPLVSARTGIAGYVREQSVYFVHASQPIAQWISSTGTPPVSPLFALESANARLLAWSTAGENTATHTLTFEGHLPLRARLTAPGCELQPSGTISGLRALRRGSQLDIEAITAGNSTVVLRCSG